MKRIYGSLLVCFWLTLLTACSGTRPSEDIAIGDEAQGLVQRHAQVIMRMRPVRATSVGIYDEDIGLRVADAMDDYSAGQMREWRRAVRKMRSELAALPDQAMTPLTRDALDEIYRVYQGAEEIPFGYVDSAGRHRPYIINQIQHPLQHVPYVMTEFQRVESAEDAADYLRRMWALSSLVDSVLGKFNFDADAGWLPPRPVLEGGLAFLEGFVDQPADEHPLVTSLLEKVDAAGTFNAKQREQIRNEAIAVMLRMVYPAYRNAAGAVRVRLPDAEQKAGIWARPLGDAFYANAMRNEALTSLSAEEIHDIGLAEVERILNAMDTRLQSLGLSGNSVAFRMQQLARDPAYLYPETDAGREALLASVQDTVADMQRRLPAYFGQLPDQPVKVERMPLDQEAGGAMGVYWGPAVGGEGAGLFLLNMRSMAELPWFTLPTLVYHETVPGHHLQTALSRARSERPLLWRVATNSAFSEGWALYAERLAAEMGVYQGDVAADLGRLQYELQRAVRLVVDTGLHYKRWSIDESSAYMSRTLGRGEQETRAEVLRYVAWPGQALSYTLGMRGILELRAELQEAMGENFEIRDFHDRVLAIGPVSVPLLKKHYRDSVAVQQATATP